ncbi:ImmA/IrrE family metallo-endopeptidase [Deinococcus sp.]|uniref:ImmA/IrrE family metallo-endopeptidase n=1 Tax=Deinococcus sp. TaxID=47478 RepID=UPI003CC68F47
MIFSDPVQALLSEVEATLSRLGHPAPARLARDLGIGLIYDAKAGSHGGPPSVVTLPLGLSAVQERQMLAHEIGHIFMQRSGLEHELRAQWSVVGPETFRMHNETIAAHVAGLILLPTPLRIRAEARYGVTPAAALRLQKASGLELRQVLDRLVYVGPDACRGAFVTCGNILTQLKTNNVWVDKSQYDRIHEVAALMPGAALRSIAPRQVLGLGSWSGALW